MTIYKTPWGWVGLAATERGIAALVLPKRSRSSIEVELKKLTRVVHATEDPSGVIEHWLALAKEQVVEYLAGKRRNFDLPIDFEGHPRFRRRVWQVLQSIPYGRVRSYGWVARKIGQPRACRAVGGACGANPLPLFVPCHRVLAGDGSLGGFSGGLSVKKRLLKLEGTIGTGLHSASRRRRAKAT